MPGFTAAAAKNDNDMLYCNGRLASDAPQTYGWWSKEYFTADMVCMGYSHMVLGSKKLDFGFVQ